MGFVVGNPDFVQLMNKCQGKPPQHQQIELKRDRANALRDILQLDKDITLLLNEWGMFSKKRTELEFVTKFVVSCDSNT